MQDTQRAAQLAFEIREHREWQVSQRRIMTPPCQMNVMLIGADFQHLCVTFDKLVVSASKLYNLRWADKSKINWPEEHHEPPPAKSPYEFS
jgi:hypothetical protein